MTDLLLRPPAYITAGGRSSRFGTDKARALLGGQPLIRHVADALAPIASSVTVIAATAGAYDDLGFRTIADRRSGLGPMAGLDSALADFDSDWLLLASCDTAGLRTAWISHLLHAAIADPDAPAVAFAHPDGRWDPLPALWHIRIRPAVDAALVSGRRALWRLLTDTRATAVVLPHDWHHGTAINTPADLAIHATKRCD